MDRGRRSRRLKRRATGDDSGCGARGRGWNTRWTRRPLPAGIDCDQPSGGDHDHARYPGSTCRFGKHTYRQLNTCIRNAAGRNNPNPLKPARGFHRTTAEHDNSHAADRPDAPDVKRNYCGKGPNGGNGYNSNQPNHHRGTHRAGNHHGLGPTSTRLTIRPGAAQTRSLALAPHQI